MRRKVAVRSSSVASISYRKFLKSWGLRNSALNRASSATAAAPIHLEDLEAGRLLVEKELVDVPVERRAQDRAVQLPGGSLDPAPRHQRDPALLRDLRERDDVRLASPGRDDGDHLVDDGPSVRGVGASRGERGEEDRDEEALHHGGILVLHTLPGDNQR